MMIQKAPRLSVSVYATACACILLFTACTGGGDAPAPGASAAQSSVEVTLSGQGIANGVDTAFFAITVRDSGGNPLGGIPVQISVSGVAVVTSPGETNPEGLATGTMTTLVGGPRTVTIVVNPGASDEFTLTREVFFNGDPEAISGVASSIAITPSTGVVADGSDSATILVRLVDQNGNPVSGQTVSFSTTGNGITLPSPVVTDQFGIATGTATSTVAGTSIINAVVNPGQNAVVLSNQPTVTFVADVGTASIMLSSIQVFPESGVLADGSSTAQIIVQVVDANGNPVSGQEITFSASGSGNIVGAPTITDENGLAIVTIASTVPELKDLGVSLPGSSGSNASAQTQVSFVTEPIGVSGSLSSVVASPSTGLTANGADASVVTITLVDATNQPIPSMPITVQVLGPMGGLMTMSAGTTDMAGQATASFSSTHSGIHLVSAIVNPSGPSPFALPQSPIVLFTSDVTTISSTQSTMTANPTVGIPADGATPSIVTVRIFDSMGNAVPGQTVALSSTGSATISGPFVTNGAGVATFSVTSTQPGAQSISATVSNGVVSQVTLAQTPTLIFVEAPTTGGPTGGGNDPVVSASLSDLVASPTTLMANGSDASTVTATVRDTTGQPMANRTVVLTILSGQAQIGHATQVTDSSGQASTTVTSTQSGQVVLGLIVNPGVAQSVVSDQPVLTFIPEPSPSAAASSVVASPTSGLSANGVDSSLITITVRDDSGNTLENVPVQISSNQTFAILSQPMPTDAEGRTTATLASSALGVHEITVVTNPGTLQEATIDQHPTVSFGAGNVSASASSVTATPTQGVVANGVDTTTISVVIRDAQGHPISGIPLVLSATGSNNSISSTNLVSDGAGMASATVASITAESKTFTVIANPSASPTTLLDQPTVTFVGDAAQIDVASLVVASPTSGVLANGLASATLTATVTDVFGNPLSGLPILVSSSLSGSSASPAGVTSGTGESTSQITSTVSGTTTLSVTVNPGASGVTLSTQPTVSFIADSSSISATLTSVTASPSTGVIANGTAVSTITVVVADSNGNPVPGQSVAVSSSGGGNTLSGPVVTNGSGQAMLTIASTVAETKTLTATINPGGSAVVAAAMPTVTFVGDPATMSATLTSVTASPATGVLANGVQTSTVTVVISDANGNPVANQTVMLSASGSNNVLTQPAATNALGQTTGGIASITAEVKTLTATLDPGGANQVVASSAPTVEFIGDASNIDGAASTVTANPTSGVVANGTDTTLISVTLLDINGNAIPSAPVSFAATGTGNTLIQPSATSSMGTTSGTLSSTVAETKVITVTAGTGPTAVVLSQSPSVDFVGDAANVSASLSTLMVSPSNNVTANNIDVATAQIQLLDANGNPIPGATVALSVTGTNNTVSTPALTDVNGMTTATITSTTAETKTVSAVAGGVTLAAMPTVTFVANAAAISAGLSTVSASPTMGVVADGSQTSTISVTVVDGFGNPVPGQTVMVAATGSNNTVSTPALTDVNGMTTATIASITAEVKTISVTVNPGASQVDLTSMPTVEFIGDASTLSDSLSSFVANPVSGVVANGVATSVLTVTVVDANGNPVSGQTVQIAATGSNNVISSPALTDSSGQTTATIASTTAESKALTATLNPGAGQVVVSTMPTVDFIADASSISATLTSVMASPASGVVANGVTTSTITVVVVDANGNPVPGQTVSFASTGSNNTISSPAATDMAGMTSATIASTTAETKTITATINPGASQVIATAMPTIDFIGDASAISAGLSSVVASPMTGVVANGTDSSLITVTVLDQNSNPLAGQVVQIAATGSNNTLTMPAVTDAAGQTSATLTTTSAEVKTVSVTIDPAGAAVVATSMPTVEFIGDASTISALSSTAVASPTSGVVADGTTASTITVTVVDANGNPVSGQTVDIAATGSNNTVSTPAATDSAGQTSATIASTSAETKTLTVTINPGGSAVVLATMPTVEFIADVSTMSASLSTVSANPSTGVVADGMATSILTLTVVDANGNPVSGQSASFASTGSNNAISGAGMTDAAGQTTATIASTTAETKTITATIDPGGSPIVVSSTPTVEFIGDAANISAASSGAVANPATGVVANGTDTSTITVTVVDQNGNPVPGQTVQLSSTGSNNTLVQPGLTDALGQASGTLASTTVELKTIMATINPGGSAVVVSTMPTVQFASDPSSVTPSSITVMASPTSGIPASGTDTSTITVTILDAGMNPVQGQTVQITSTGINNTISTPAVTDAAGQTTATIASTTPETKTLTITMNPAGTPVVSSTTPTVTFDPFASPIISAVTAAPSTGLNADGTQASTISITVADANGAPVQGATVVISATGPGNVIVQPMLTDAFGMTSGTLAATTPETKTVTVTVNPGPSQSILNDMPTVEFVPFLSGALYVRTTGSDPVGCTGGTSPATAFATITAALACASPGDTVYVGGGTYPESVSFSTSGTMGSPITLIADESGSFTGDAGEVVIDATGLSVGISTNGQDFLNIVGFTITGAFDTVLPSGGLYVNSADVGIRENTIHGNVAGVVLDGATNSVIESNSISNNQDQGISLVGSSSATIVNNLIYNNAEGLSLSLGTSMVTLRSSTFYMNAMNQVFASAAAHVLNVHNCILSDTPGDGFNLGAGVVLTNDYNNVFNSGGSNYVGAVAGANSISADPAFEDPDGADDILGGANGSDDQFQLSFTLPSTSIDVGSGPASSELLSTGASLGSYTTRIDGGLDGGAFDGATVNLGFHYPPTTTPLPNVVVSDARLFYGLLGDAQSRVRTWFEATQSYTGEAVSFPSAAEIKWIITRLSPLSTPLDFKMILSDLGSTGRLSTLRWYNGSWNSDWSSTAITSTDTNYRGFDLEFEASSGDVITVYANNTQTPVYRVFSGGVWSAEASLPLNDGAGPNPDTNTGTVQWVELASRGGSDEVSVAFADSNSDLVIMSWDGTQWLTNTATTLATDLRVNSILGVATNRVFDLTYENLSGRLMVALGRDPANGVGAWYAYRDFGQTAFTALANIPAPTGDGAHFVDIDSEPGGNRIGGAFLDMGTGGERLGLAVWNPNTLVWDNPSEYDSTMRDSNDTSVGDFEGAISWLGTSGVCVALYPDFDPGTLDWYRYDSVNGWVQGADIVIPGKGLTESVQVIPYPAGDDRVYGLWSDTNSDIYGAIYDGTTWTVVNGGASIANGFSSDSSVPWHFSFKREVQ